MSQQRKNSSRFSLTAAGIWIGALAMAGVLAIAFLPRDRQSDAVAEDAAPVVSVENTMPALTPSTPPAAGGRDTVLSGAARPAAAQPMTPANVVASTPELNSTSVPSAATGPDPGELINQKKYTEAISALREILAAAKPGQNTARTHLFMATAYGMRAGTMSSPDDADQAVYHLKEVLRQEPENVDGLRGLAMAYYYMQHAGDAIPLLETASRIAPDRADVWSSLGQAYAKVGDREKAKSAFTRALELNPDDQIARKGIDGL